MTFYQAPLEDMRFLINEVWTVSETLNLLPMYQEINSDIIDAVLTEAGKIASNVLHPINQQGDEEGCQFNQGQVTVPNGFKNAYKTVAEGGWMALTAKEQYGGQQLPHFLSSLVDEIFWSANTSFQLYANLTHGVYRAIEAHASDKLKQTYLPSMVSGNWSGVMCLTESHCGTDLGLLNTKATANDDGSFNISGTKIFITSGEHDMSDNIIHLVLARIEGAPKGAKGISLFLVPKMLVKDNGELGDKNTVSCGAIEHKMGINGSCTCVMNYDKAKGFLVGQENKGLQAMFTVMNAERLSIGLQGLGLAEVAYQNALAYAKDRLQGRAATGPSYPQEKADPLIVHPDVRRMLLLQKAYCQGARSIALWVGLLLDNANAHPDKAERATTQKMVDLFTPVVKAFFTDLAMESCLTAQQVFGGHGYIKEWGMEQFVRDARIAQIYEGANGIQALDLVKRKLVGDNGESFNLFKEYVDEFVQQFKNEKHLEPYITPLKESMSLLSKASDFILDNHANDANLVGAASNDYLHLFGLSALAFAHAKAASVSFDKDDNMHKNKCHLALFYMHKMLPRITMHYQSLMHGSNTLMAIADSQFD